MTKPRNSLTAAPIVEAVVDIDCDMPTNVDVEALDAAVGKALIAHYPTSRKRLLSEHQISAAPDGPLSLTSRQGLHALQYFSADEKQLIQLRPNGYSFNRLSPYSSLDDYLPEIERTWRIFVDVAKPILCRTVRLRYINRISLPLTEGRVEIDDYLNLAPRLADEDRLTFVGFFNQNSVLEPSTGNRANIVFATESPVDGCLPVIFDIEALKDVSIETADWEAVTGIIQSLRSLKNLVFENSLTEKCLNLFRP